MRKIPLLLSFALPLPGLLGAGFSNAPSYGPGFSNAPPYYAQPSQPPAQDRVLGLDGTPVEHAKTLTAEIAALREQNTQLQRDIILLGNENAALREQLAQLSQSPPATPPPPPPPTPLSHSMAIPAADGTVELQGDIVQIIPDGVIVRTRPNDPPFLLTGHPDQAMLYDNSPVRVKAVQTGVYKFGYATIGKFRVVSVIKYNPATGQIISEIRVPPPISTPISRP